MNGALLSPESFVGRGSLGRCSFGLCTTKNCSRVQARKKVALNRVQSDGERGYVSQTLSYLCSDTCFSSYLSLLLRTLSVLPSLAARTCQSYLFYFHLSPAPVRPICSLGVTLVDYKRCALLIIGSAEALPILCVRYFR